MRLAFAGMMMTLLGCRVIAASGQIVLSEIMFNPAGSERYDEFIELYNLSTLDSIDLHGWLISDSSGWNRISAGPSGRTRLPPRSYALLLVPGYFTSSGLYAGRIPDAALVLTIDKSQFGNYGLNNSRSERVSVHRPDSLLADAHAYTVPHDEGLSEEKLQLELGEAAGNWGESQVPGGTPGYANSVLPARIDSSRAQVVINEIMANPTAGESEWIECYNVGRDTARLTGWRMSDADTLEKRLLVKGAASPVCVPPQGYLVLTGEESLLAQLPASGCTGVVVSSWPGLNSSSEGIVLYDGLGRHVDEVWYEAEWGGARGISLERLSPLVAAAVRSNWGSCADPLGHTAGRANSLLVGRLPAEAAIAVSPNPFSPDGDGFEDHLAISLALPARTARINLRIFDSAGRQVRFLCNYEPSGSRKAVFWDGLDDEGRRCRIGIYILYLEAFEESSEAFMRAKKACVLAGRL
ncbi:MAG TPA: lamin tail domain-containing protein [bacterium]|nr:lamin tail domain-containing protein [bacterium]HPR89064.1 lamin tail domain-containing protein [bacterium]